ncbi:MAG: cell wall-binding repeat-containing protein, partial [Firmicutes bacterium]|nr:cell wall-binding repeat-containing protein [Bacillota bacterium]
GQGHQGLLLIEVNEQTMTGKIIACDLWHSFMQYIQADSDKLYLLEQSEGSYCTSLKRFGMSGSAEATLAVLHYGGQRTSPWAVPCYASVDDLAVSGSNVLGLGASIDQSLYDSVNQDTPHNLYLTVTPKSNFTEAATNVVWLTNYQGDGKCFLGTKITKVNDNRFLIMWEEYGSEQPATAGDPLSSSILHYLFVNGAGQKISKEYTAAAPLSDCHPVLNGTKVYWYASSGNAVNFYSIGAADGAFRKEKAYRTAGERVTWNLKGDVLTFTGEGPLTIDTETHYRYPRSSTGGGYSYSNSDNCWSPIREQVKKIVIADGITEIPANAFRYFENLTDVEVAESVKKIGQQAFAFNDRLRNVTIYSRDAKIGEDLVWNGYYWVTDDGSKPHVYWATIYCYKGSTAEAYARKYDISFRYIPEDISKAQVKLAKTSYVYNGSARQPAVTVTFRGQRLTAETDYTVSYRKNVNVGTATVTITGIDAYKGTIKRTFTITPAALASAKVSGLAATYTYTGKTITPQPVVKVGSRTLKKGTDYTLKYAQNVAAGTATLTITGTGNYTGSLKKTFTIVKPSYIRLAGADRYATSLAIADAYKKELGVSQFTTICVADGVNFPDALAGAYFAGVNKAPIVDIRQNAPTGPQTMNAINYVKRNLKAGGKVYILGGPGSVPETVENALKKAGFQVSRLWGSNRYMSNCHPESGAHPGRERFHRRDRCRFRRCLDGQRDWKARAAGGRECFDRGPEGVPRRCASEEFYHHWLDEGGFHRDRTGTAGVRDDFPDRDSQRL